ncbi:unnamed protein product [Rotaria magnacalcarata]|uniref:Large-conductance mechanosensitive channel n=1 Tax=Rotaria magnacalcarata TaxID=392030 RepID=A0A816UT95_9BILA|nr:unnamed protein product [Rotaria magnacalcarata]CAF2111717.1 unnamed protein product [Rotaria magnacalcarata]CAF2117528.1 unnamed protein product [Rotaria magnacalcarata]CAF3747848.1 unnamed protein product [Rotaria magnacalcarata]CAF3891383.1 unnamed protein product [Rotaria magnacalcarata]
MGGCCGSVRLFCKDFRDFALQGRVIDLAVAFVIGRAFSAVVKSLVNDILLPPFGFLFGGVEFFNLTIKMHNFAYPDNPPVVIRYGQFIQTLIYLLIVSFALFCIIVLVARFRSGHKKENNEGYDRVPEISEQIKLLAEIRDLLGTKLDPKT